MLSPDIPITPDRIKHALIAQGMPSAWAEDVFMALSALEGGWNSTEHDSAVRMAMRLCPEISQLLGGAQAPQSMQATFDSSSIVIR